MKAFTSGRVKDDIGGMPLTWRELLRMAGVGELREIVCYHKLVGLRASCTDQVHAVLAKLGAPVAYSGTLGARAGVAG